MRWSLHGPHGLLGVERQLRDQRRPGLQARQDAGLVTEVVEERVDAQVAVVAGDLAALGPRRRAGQRLPMRAQRALAAAGGAGGEQDVGDVVGLDRRGARVDGLEGSGFLAARDELVPGSVVLLDRYPDDVPQFGQGVAVDRSGLVGAEELTGCEQQRCAGPRQDVAGLAGGVAGVQRHEHAAGVGGGQARDHPVPGVRRPDRDPVPGADAQVDHRGGGSADLVAQLGECQPPTSPAGPPAPPAATSASCSENRSAIRSRTCGMVLGIGLRHRCSSNKASAW